MNQGKLEVVKQEMARMNVNILGISELKWTGMGEFNSDDHYIYYCVQESLRRNGVAIIVNKRVWNAVLGCNLKNDRMISVHFQGKPFNITVIQAYTPTSNAEEAERFYEDLWDLLELTPKKGVLFIIGDWHAKIGIQETPGVTGKFGLGVWNKAGQTLIEFCQEIALVIANTLFQQHKRRLYTWKDVTEVLTVIISETFSFFLKFVFILVEYTTAYFSGIMSFLKGYQKCQCLRRTFQICRIKTIKTLKSRNVIFCFHI